jgi:serine protease
MRTLIGTAALLVGLAAAASASASPTLEPSRLAHYVDRGQRVDVERLGPGRTRRLRQGARPGRAALRRRPPRDRARRSHAIVQLEPGAGVEALEALGLRPVRVLMPSIGLWLVEEGLVEDGLVEGDGLALAERLSSDSARARGVRAASPNLYLARRRFQDPPAPYTPNDPRFPGQWYFDNLGMTEAWGYTRGSATTSIVVVDTGCDMTHPDLVDKLDGGRDVVDGDDDPSYLASDQGAAHGTQCAGIVGASTDNDEGIAGGCPECRVRCVRMLSDAPTPLSADVQAFQYALETEASVVSNSWGFVQAIPVPSALESAIVEVATNGRGGKGAMVLFAAGNDDREIGDDELQAVEGVICVGAVNNFDDSTPFTNRGRSLDIVAPTGTLTTDIQGAGGDDPSDYTSLFGGTSSACPVAAGVAGLLVSAAPEKTGAELSRILIETTRPAPYAEPDAQGHDLVYGYGIIQPAEALRVALGLSGLGGGGGGPGGSDDDFTDVVDEGGCGCNLPGAGAPLDWRAQLAAGAASLVLARRRRRR